MRNNKAPALSRSQVAEIERAGFTPLTGMTTRFHGLRHSQTRFRDKSVVLTIQPVRRLYLIEVRVDGTLYYPMKDLWEWDAWPRLVNDSLLISDVNDAREGRDERQGGFR